MGVFLRTLGQVQPARRAAGVSFYEGTEERTISFNKMFFKFFDELLYLFSCSDLVGVTSPLGNIYFIFTGNLRHPRYGSPIARHSFVLHFPPLVLMV